MGVPVARQARSTIRNAQSALDALAVPGGYRFTLGADATLLSTAFALQTQSLLGLDGVVARPALAELLGTQDARGHFVDPAFSVADTTGSHAPAYIQEQTTFFVLSALDACGVAPNGPLTFIDELLDPGTLRRWLDGLDWRKFWYSSNRIMFLLFFLAYRWKRQGDTDARAAALACLQQLDQRQLASSGFWGDPANPVDGMYGAAHIYMFYDFFERPIVHAEQAIDATLALQQETGVFGTWHGGACEDYDGVEVLIKVSRQTSHRAHDVRAALERAHAAIDASRLPSGGFSYWILPKGASVLDRFRAFRQRNATYTYSGWQRMTAPRFGGDTWATFFRVLSMASIERHIGQVQGYRFTELPCWGYFGNVR